MDRTKQIIKTLKKGQLVYVQTAAQEMIGRIHLIDKIRCNFIVIHVKDLMPKGSYASSLQLVPTEIMRAIFVTKNLRLIDVSHQRLTSNLKTASDIESSDSNSTASTFYTAIESTTDVKLQAETPPRSPAALTAAVILTNYEIASIQKRIDNFIFVHQKNAAYDLALNDIEDQPCIALLVQFKNSKASAITVATIQTIYVFDALMLPSFFCDFKNVLESEKPRKAVHYAHPIVEQLKISHNIHLDGIFDTYASYCAVTGDICPVNFPSIIEKFFNIDRTFFNREHLLNPHMEVHFLQECAKRACLLLKLQEHLQNKMLSRFYEHCQDYAHSFLRIEDMVVATDKMQKNELAGSDGFLSTAFTTLDLRDQTLF